MIRLARNSTRAILAGSFAIAAVMAGMAPASANVPGAFYRAELASPLDAPRKEVLNGVVWRCERAICSASKAGARAEIVCGRLASKVGAIASFSHGDAVLDETALARCNRG